MHTENNNDFKNSSYFILPLKVAEPARLDAFLKKNPSWQVQKSALDTQYILHYAATMDDVSDGRLRIYRHSADDLRFYFFDSRIAERLERLGISPSGCSPEMGGISLYLFGTGVAFLEFQVLFGGMNIFEIVEFVYLFRRLRNNEQMKWLHFPEGSISPETAAEKLLPQKESGTLLCFSNPSPIKKQANIFTMIDMKCCSPCEPPAEDAGRFCRLLAHGANNSFADDADPSSQYRMNMEFGQDEYWGGSQDGLAVVTNQSYAFQYKNLCMDHHFMYLLLLNQRFASVAFIEEFSRSDMDLSRSQRIKTAVVKLKTRYSFRVISDDKIIQSVYNSMYGVLELDELLEDLEEANDQINELLQTAREKHDKRFEALLGALSILAIFSALVDFSDYLDRFTTAETLHTIISLVTTAAILVIAVILIFRRKE